MILEQNMFVERVLPASIIRRLSEEEMVAYPKPFASPGEDRRPTLPRMIPIEGKPVEMVKVVENYAAWLAETGKTIERTADQSDDTRCRRVYPPLSACTLFRTASIASATTVSSPTQLRRNLGFSHASARPKAYKHNAEAMDAFKKTSPRHIVATPSA